MKKIICILSIFLISIISVFAVSVSMTSGQLSGGKQSFTITLSDTTNVKLWKIKDITVPTGYTFDSKSFSGASGANHNELCGTQDDGKYACSMLADTGSVVANSVTLTYNVVGTQGNLQGTWEVYKGSQMTDSGNLGGGVPPPDETEETSTSGFNWMWIIGGIAVVAIIYMMKK